MHLAALTTHDAGLGLGPRLNAAGRLSDARPAANLLYTQNAGRACALAKHLEELNDVRKRLTQQIMKEATALVRPQVEAGRR